MSNQNYIACELRNVNVEKPSKLVVQFQADGLKTKWLNITQAQFTEIERILTLGNERPPQS